MKEYDYFYCLLCHDPDNKQCVRDMFRRKACSECIRKGDCRICGRQETELCNSCTYREDEIENGKEI